MNTIEWRVPVSSETAFVNPDKDSMYLLSLAGVQGQYYCLTEELLKDKANANSNQTEVNLNQLSRCGFLMEDYAHFTECTQLSPSLNIELCWAFWISTIIIDAICVTKISDYWHYY